MNMREYMSHSDPGHGWLEIPLSEFRELDISVSKYSYYDTDNVYLEKDQDAGLAIKALKDQGIDISFDEVHYNDPCFIRDLYRFAITETRSPGL